MKGYILGIILLLMFIPSTVSARSHPYFILDISASNDGRYVAISRMDNKLVLLDIEKQKVVNVFTSNKGMQSSVNFTPDGKYFVFQNAKAELLFYDIAKEEITKKYQLDKGVYSLAFFNDNNRFVWGSANGKIEYVNIAKDERIMLKKPIPEDVDISSFDWPILHVVISPDERYFLTTTFTDGEYALRSEPEKDFKYVEEPWGKNPKTGGPASILKYWEVRHLGLNLWDAKSLKKIKKLGAKFISGRCWPVFSPDMKYILASSENGSTLFDIITGEILFENHEGANGVGFLDENTYVTLFASDSLLVLYKVTENMGIRYKKGDMLCSGVNKVIKANYHPCTGALATVPTRNLIITGDRDGSISVYKYLPDKNDIEFLWHPKAISAGLIRWLSPLETMNLNEVEIEELQRRYEAEQRKIIEKDKKEDKVLAPSEIEY